MLKELNKEQVLQEIQTGKPKLLVFYAQWCGPCRMYKSSLEEIASKDGLDVLRVDIDAHKEFAGESGVQSIPFSQVYNNGKLVKQFTGFKPYEVLKQDVQEILK
ncbi:thioredoxin family protein [Mycoplasmopsis felis]|uniref:thioredoxin family protein n=1 Tax=Mycoplasmopsis felis TaxID=33923 RepID=UPI002AFF1774|nr:thioredoxin family protein [Mycoplasmopsis felis]WQQ11025.1 thioredoxin family protein [Mycoplasmopsis felis]